LLVALGLVANVCSVTDDWSVSASQREVSGSGHASVVGASVVIVTEVGSDRSVDTSCSDVASVVRANVLVITSDGGVGAFCVGDISRGNTDVCCAGALVIALAVVVASRLGRAQVGEVNDTSGRNTLVVGTLGVGRNRNRGENAALNWIARRNGTLVRSSARRDRGVLAHEGRRDGGHSENTLVIGTSVVVVTVHVNGTLRDRTSGLVNNDSLHRIARNRGASVGNNGKRNRGLLASQDFITGGSVANILWVARDDGISTEVLQWVAGVGCVANIIGADVAIGTVGWGRKGAGWLGARSELSCRDVTSGCVTSVIQADGRGRDRNWSDNATG